MEKEVKLLDVINQLAESKLFEITVLTGPRTYLMTGLKAPPVRVALQQ